MKDRGAGWKEISEAFKEEGRGDLTTNVIRVRFYRLKDKMAVWEAEDVCLPTYSFLLFYSIHSGFDWGFVLLYIKGLLTIQASDGHLTKGNCRGGKEEVGVGERKDGGAGARENKEVLCRCL